MTPGPWASFRRALVAIFVLALAMRALHVVEIGRTPFARLLVGDARSYDAWAAEIASGQWVGTRTFYQAPLYPYALAVVYATAGRDPMTVRWVQAVAGALACVLLALAGRSWLSAREGIVAGGLLALYPPAIFFDGLVQKASLDGVLVCALLAVLGAYVARPRRGVLLAAGAVLGALALTRENALVFAVIVLAWIPLHLGGRSWRERAATMGAFALGIALVLVPVGLRNLAVGGEFLVTTSQAGPNFYIGNHAGATGHYVPLRPGREMPEFERVDATDLAQRALGKTLTPGEVSSYWWGRSFAWIAESPGAWLSLLAHKALLTWNRMELPDTESLSVHADASVVLRVLGAVFGFGVLVPVAIAGVVMSWGRRPRPTLLIAMLFGFSAAVALFYVFSRYRFPMVPLLVLFAAHALVTAWDAMRAGRGRTLLPAAAAGLAAAAIVHWPLESVAEERGGSYANLGIALAAAGRLDEAIVYYRRGIEADPSNALTHAVLGAALASTGRAQEAGDALVTALRLDPSLGMAHRSLAMLLAGRGEFAGAERHLRDLVRIEPSSMNRTDLANAVLEQGRREEAIALYREVLSSEPTYLDARLNLAHALLIGGRRAEAIAEVREAVRLAPDSADARRALAELE